MNHNQRVKASLPFVCRYEEHMKFCVPVFFYLLNFLNPVFHLATSFALREAKTRFRQRDWLKLAGEIIRREQVGTVPTGCFPLSGIFRAEWNCSVYVSSQAELM